ncbi:MULTISPECIES: Hsp20/alpha crystallin family protein [Citricoccus]|uniref:Hsp20/alpha crystallin family protein n=1 Tax=Citricoccus TaxID=169133 RepID=UPI000255E163|nr:Hsp20/alpha crystallin family protein [Citricoccus sp. CH26A]
MANHVDPLREIDRVLNGVFGQMASSVRTQAMPMDLYRSEDHFVLKVDLPGVDPRSIDVDLEGRTLTIRADRQDEETGQIQWLARERTTGTFARQLTLGEGLATDRIDASYTDGVLTLQIPVAEEAKPRRIEVSHTANQGAIGQSA